MVVIQLSGLSLHKLVQKGAPVHHTSYCKICRKQYLVKSPATSWLDIGSKPPTARGQELPSLGSSAGWSALDCLMPLLQILHLYFLPPVHESWDMITSVPGEVLRVCCTSKTGVYGLCNKGAMQFLLEGPDTNVRISSYCHSIRFKDAREWDWRPSPTILCIDMLWLQCSFQNDKQPSNIMLKSWMTVGKSPEILYAWLDWFHTH